MYSYVKCLCAEMRRLLYFGGGEGDEVCVYSMMRCDTEIIVALLFYQHLKPQTDVRKNIEHNGI